MKLLNLDVKKVSKVLLLLISIYLLDPGLALRVNPQSSPSILKRSLTKTIKGKKIQFNLAQINANQVKVKVIGVYSLLQQQTQNAPSYSLQEVINNLKPQAIINGGFSASFSIPTPTGLLVSKGKTIYRMNTVGKVTNGILCIGQKISIVMSNNYKKSNCLDALQSGPILVKSGQVDRQLDQLPIYKGNAERSVVAIDKQGRLLLISTTPITLPNLAELLTQEGLDCVSALNLGGSTDSGLYINTQGSKPFKFGRLDSPIASAIAVFQD